MKLNNSILKNKVILSLLIIAVLLTNSFAKVTGRISRRKNSNNKIQPRDSKTYAFATDAKDGNSGSIYSLANHNVACADGSALSGFHFWGKTGIISNDNAYEWNCFKDANVLKETYKVSTVKVKVEKEKDSSHLLNDLPIECKKGFAIQQFQLQKDGEQIYYVYTCVKVNYADKDCQIIKSKWIDAAWGIFAIGNRSVSQLDEIPLNAAAGSAITSFSLLYNMNKKQVSYQGSACKLGKVEEIKPPQTNAKIKDATTVTAQNEFSGDEKSFYGLNIDCKGKLLSSLNISVVNKKAQADFSCKDHAKIGKKAEDFVDSQRLFYGSSLINCPSDYGLSSISFAKSDKSNLLMVNYRCVPIPLKPGLVRFIGPEFSENNGFKFLATTQVNSDPAYAITLVYWKPNRDEKSSFKNYQLVVYSNPIA